VTHWPGNKTAQKAFPIILMVLSCGVLCFIWLKPRQGAMAHSLGVLAANAHVEGGIWGRKKLIIKGNHEEFGAQFY